MVLPDYPPPSKSDRTYNRGSSQYGPRHISLQSRVESQAAESTWDDNRESLQSLPAMYRVGRESDVPLMGTITLARPNYASMKYDEATAAYFAHPTEPDDSPASSETRKTGLGISTLHEILFIGVVIQANFLSLAGFAQSIAPMNYIARGLGTSNPGEIAWFTASYSLTAGTFILISGRMGDIIGHKRVFAFGLFWLGCWSAFAGFGAYVRSQIYFDVCRSMEGIGSALLAPNALALFGRAYPPGIKKNIVFSLFGAMAPWGFVISAVFHSLFAEVTWWPWGFWAFGIASWSLSALSVLVIPRALNHEAQFAEKDNNMGMDWTGSALGVIGLVLVNIAWNNGPLFGWDKPHVYIILIIGIISLVAFVWVERRALSPLLPISAMSSTVVYTMLLIGIGWGSFGIWIWYSWRFLEEIRQYTPLSVSAQYTPALICGLLASGATGFMLTHTPVAFTMMIAMLAFFGGELITVLQPVKEIYWAQMFVAIIIMPFGMDMSFPAGTVILSNAMPAHHQGLAGSLVVTMVNYSISIALGVAGTVEIYGTKRDDPMQGIRAAWWTGVGLAGVGVVLGAAFFVRTVRREGWRVMDH